MNDELTAIQKLQFSDQARAEERLRGYLHAVGLDDIRSIRLNPKPESLNSVNGFAELTSGETLFFKTHTEENEQLSEYYNHQVLEEAGYPVLSAGRVRTSPGSQIAFYEIITHPTFFDVVKEEEDRLLGAPFAADESSAPCASTGRRLIEAQEGLDSRLFEIYRATLRPGPESFETAPIHQLFFHRLDPAGRLGLFYDNGIVRLPGAAARPFKELAALRWRINGVTYPQTLAELASRARDLLDPKKPQATAVGHGDAHNGNVFYDKAKNELYYFDPAFAGRHSPLLDLVKPLFHNVFARWMYFPEECAAALEIEWSERGGLMEVRHTFEPSALRKGFLRSKRDRVLGPLVALLQDAGALPADWQQYLSAALLCCPLLTVNLAAEHQPSGTLAERYPPAIKLLGLCMTIEMGSLTGQGVNPIRAELDSCFAG